MDRDTKLLLALTSIPTAAGREQRVVEFVEAWAAQRPSLVLRRDPHGNIEISLPGRSQDTPPIYFTAHLDHPAFVVERVIGPGTVELAFRGGVMDAYFEGAEVELYPDFDAGSSDTIRGTITGRGDLETPFKSWVAELESESDAIRPGDVARWRFPAAEIIEKDLPAGGRGDVLYTHACDDLAAAAAALVAFDRLLKRVTAGEAVPDVRLLFTLAEEIGFIGAIGASKDGFMPRGSRIIALENSRSFPHDSPIGGGPIVRVGDRVSTFSPQLTAAVAKAAQNLETPEADPDKDPTTVVKKPDAPRYRWQRKLMPGGACEASVFCAYGYEATCVCLPLGNYHNMANLAEAQKDPESADTTPGREHVAMSDWFGMIDLLEACGMDLPGPGAFTSKLDELWGERSFVLGGER